MKQRTIKRPEVILVRGVRFILSNPPAYWSENQHHELFCDKCGRSLAVFFAAREDSKTTSSDPRWWIPTSISCSCLLPETLPLHELPIEHRRHKRDVRQLEFPLESTLCMQQ